MRRRIFPATFALSGIVGLACGQTERDARGTPPAQESQRLCDADQDCDGFTGEDPIASLLRLGNGRVADCVVATCTRGYCVAAPQSKPIADDRSGDCARPRCDDGRLVRDFAEADAPPAEGCRIARCSPSGSSPFFGPGTIVWEEGTSCGAPLTTD